MEIVKDILVVYGRILTIIPLLIIVTLLMGKRSIGEVPVFDFLIIITLGSIVGADLADPNVHHIPTAVAVTSIGIIQRLISITSIKKRWFGRFITFEPTIVIRDGTFLVGNMRKIRYSIDNILMMLREKGVFDVDDVELAIVEANGKLTVNKKAHKANVTIEDLNLKKQNGGVAYPVIVEGTIYPNILTQLNLDDEWLIQQLKKKGVNPADVFFASVTENNKIHFSLNNNLKKSHPEILH